jgi:hypothetical protein
MTPVEISPLDSLTYWTASLASGKACAIPSATLRVWYSTNFPNPRQFGILMQRRTGQLYSRTASVGSGCSPWRGWSPSFWGVPLGGARNVSD